MGWVLCGVMSCSVCGVGHLVVCVFIVKFGLCVCMCSMCSVGVVCVILCFGLLSFVRGAWNVMSGSW